MANVGQHVKQITALQLFGTTVRERRNQLGLTQENLAWKTGLHRSYIGAMERGGRNVSLNNILRLAVALQLPPSHLLQPFDTRRDLLPALERDDCT
jgi:transcriptional regulator with XRE-family HTH domain